MTPETMPVELEMQGSSESSPVGDSYNQDAELELYCDELGSLRLMDWGVI